MLENIKSKEPTDVLLLGNSIGDDGVLEFLKETRIALDRFIRFMEDVSLRELFNYICNESSDYELNRVVYDGVFLRNVRENYPLVKLSIRDGEIIAEGNLPEGMDSESFLSFAKFDSLAEFLFNACKAETARLIKTHEAGRPFPPVRS